MQNRLMYTHALTNMLERACEIHTWGTIPMELCCSYRAIIDILLSMETSTCKSLTQLWRNPRRHHPASMRHPYQSMLTGGSRLRGAGASLRRHANGRALLRGQHAGQPVALCGGNAPRYDAVFARYYLSTTGLQRGDNQSEGPPGNHG